MRNRYMLIGVVGIVVGVLLSSAVFVLAGNPDSPSAPGATNSFALDDIYNRLDSGAGGAQSTFTEPAAGPGTGTMHTLNDIMAKSPAADNTNGAVPGEVLTGKTYWGLRTDGTWGPRTGSVAAGSNVNGPDGSKTFNIPDGFYSGKTATANDSDLLAGNIKQGVDIFGVPGTVIQATGDATAGDVLTGKTFSNASAAGIAGTMPDKEGDNASTSRSAAAGVNYFTAPAGYYDGDDRVSATDAQVRALDAEITAGNIKKDVNIFGQVGTLTPDGGTAVAADLFNGKTTHLTNDWTLDSGTLNLACNTATFNGTDNRVADAYDGGGDGSNRWCMTDTGDAVAGDMLQGKKAWVNGSEVTGNVAAGSNVNGPDGSKTFNIPDGFYSGKTATANDSDLQAGNIKSGVGIFGVTGTYPFSGVPKTGQTASYATGDDGDLEKGVAWPSPRFTDNANGTVTDNLTGLIWLKTANCWGYGVTWANALANANSLASGACDLSDGSAPGQWRLPNVNELQSLLNRMYTNPPLPNTAGTGQWTSGNPFTNVVYVNYWTSSPYYSGDNVFVVSMWDARVSYFRRDQTILCAWPVRGGQ